MAPRAHRFSTTYRYACRWRHSEAIRYVSQRERWSFVIVILDGPPAGTARCRAPVCVSCKPLDLRLTSAVARDHITQVLHVGTVLHAGTRNRGGGGGTGGSGGNLPHNFEAVVAPPPPTLDCEIVHFYFCLFLHVNLGLCQKIVGQIRGVFSFGWGLPRTPGDVCPPPNFKVLPAPLVTCRSQD